MCSRYRASSGHSYTTVKAIAEELRDWQEANVPRLCYSNPVLVMGSDVELTDTSESFGLPATADLMFALIGTEELEVWDRSW